MRKDFIVSKEVAQQKKDRLEENRNSSSKRSSTESLVNSESLSETLDEIDRVSCSILNLILYLLLQLKLKQNGFL
jgi:hypothetical protein